jgi:acetyl-CoA C-acetyltransferase
MIPGKSVAQVHAEVALGALADAGLSMSDVDAYFCAGDAPGFGPISMADYLGLKRLRYVDSTETGGSSYLVHVGHAAAAIAVGKCRVALITLAGLPRSLRSPRASASPLAPEAAFEQPFGPTTISMYALAARRHMHEYGTTGAQLAAIKVAASQHAQHNPHAMLPNPVTVEEVLDSPMISDPLHRLDCCVISDGGGAVVLTTEERARDLPARPVYIVGAASAATHVNIPWMPDLTTTAAAVSGPRAFAQAGVQPKDIDLAMLYDSFTITALLQFEDLGFCAKGEGGAYAAETTLPYNTDGGALSSKHPGMRGIFLLTECVRRIRAGSARLAVASGIGGELSANGTVLLASETTT